jgi:glutamine synthetase
LFIIRANGSSVKCGVFGADLIETYIEYKHKSEYDQVALRPHPYEFALHFDVSSSRKSALLLSIERA